MWRWRSGVDLPPREDDCRCPSGGGLCRFQVWFTIFHCSFYLYDAFSLFFPLRSSRNSTTCSTSAVSTTSSVMQGGWFACLGAGGLILGYPDYPLGGGEQRIKLNQLLFQYATDNPKNLGKNACTHPCARKLLTRSFCSPRLLEYTEIIVPNIYVW